MFRREACTNTVIGRWEDRAEAIRLTASRHFLLAMSLFVLGGGLVSSVYPVFWSMPTMILTESTAAASFGLINSLGQLGGLVGPYAVGYLNDRTGSLAAAFVFIGVCSWRRELSDLSISEAPSWFKSLSARSHGMDHSGKPVDKSASSFHLAGYRFRRVD